MPTPPTGASERRRRRTRRCSRRRGHEAFLRLIAHSAPAAAERGRSAAEAHRMAKLEGTIAVAGLPPHRGLIVNLCFYRVEAPDAPAPYDGDPPAEAATDCHEVLKEVDLNADSSQ